MARPRLGESERRRTHDRRAGDGGRGNGGTAGASPSRVPLPGSLPAPPRRWVSGCGWRQSCGLGAAELRELNRIGVNLNQMARALNSGAVSSPAENPGGGRAGRGSWWLSLLAGESRVMVVKMSARRGARSVEWRSTACTIHGCRGRGIPRAQSGWNGRRPATWPQSRGIVRRGSWPPQRRRPRS